MEYLITIGELLDRCDDAWLRLCKLRGWNEWCVNEGQADAKEVVRLTPQEYATIFGEE